MPLKRKKLGNLGEQLAKKLLQNKGYRFLQANFHCRFGEIDLIFQDKKTLVFVEVKCRFSSRFGKPEEAVTPTKLNSIRKTIDYFYCQNKDLPKLCRIDVVGIEMNPVNLKPTSVRHLINAAG